MHKAGLGTGISFTLLMMYIKSHASQQAVHLQTGLSLNICHHICVSEHVCGCWSCRRLWLFALLQEVKEARHRYETRLVEVDSGRKQEYEYKLTEGLAEMRAQNEEQIKLYKDNMEGAYRTKVGTQALVSGPVITLQTPHVMSSS